MDIKRGMDHATKIVLEEPSWESVVARRGCVQAIVGMVGGFSLTKDIQCQRRAFSWEIGCVYFLSLLNTLGFKNEVFALLKPHKLGERCTRFQGTKGLHVEIIAQPMEFRSP